MTVTTKVELSATTNITYPAMFESHQRGEVVLFTGLTTGTLIVGGRFSNPVGHHSTHWTACLNKEVWKRLPIGTTVTLTQGE